MELKRAQAIAAVIVNELRPFCLKIEVAGSIRRERPEVGDIDIVLLPRSEPRLNRAALLNRVKQSCTFEICGQQNVQARLTKAKDFQLDLWFAKPAGDEWFEPHPTNWGAVLLCRTGSMQHNIQLCELAKSKGLAFNPYRGLVRPQPLETDEIVAAASEAEIYQALGLEYREPTQREVLL